MSRWVRPVALGVLCHVVAVPGSESESGCRTASQQRSACIGMTRPCHFDSIESLPPIYVPPFALKRRCDAEHQGLVLAEMADAVVDCLHKKRVTIRLFYSIDIMDYYSREIPNKQGYYYVPTCTIYTESFCRGQNQSQTLATHPLCMKQMK